MLAPGQTAAFALLAAVWSVCAGCSTERSADNQTISEPPYAARRMLDGKQWMTGNLNVTAADSHCYDDDRANCDRYGRSRAMSGWN